MKIAIIGTQNTGKSTYVKDFIKKWPMYKTSEKSYRGILKEKNLPHSENATEETQKVILDFLIDQVTETSKDDNVILDRSVLDCLVYSTWLCLNEKVSEKFLDQQRIIVRETLKLYDVIFFVPLTKAAPIDIEDDGFRNINPIFREEIDNIFKVFQESYHKGDGRVFPKEDTPAVIEIFGSPEERIKLTEFYITEEGKAYGEDQSLLNEVIGATPQDLKNIEKDMGIIT
jgi:adenylate kinase family enzyme